MINVIIPWQSAKDPDPYRRPGQKKQGREVKSKARKSDKWQPRKQPRPPKHHTPGREHRKYGIPIMNWIEDYLNESRE